MRLNLLGERYGYLTVISPVENINGRTAWLCKCDCGNEITVLTKYLRGKKKTSCGCKEDKGFASLHYIDGTCVEMLKTKTIRSNNRSGYTGVFFDKASKKWRAEIMLQGKRKCLGKFKYKRDAIKARKTAEVDLHQ